MSDATAGTATATSTIPPPPPPPDAPATGDDPAAEVAKWKELARKHEDRAKANAGAQKELDALKAASMSDLEKAVAQAKADGINEGLATSAQKVVAAEFKAAAAGRLDAAALSTLLDGLNLVAFIDAAGDVDSEKVQSFVDGIAPAAAPADPFAALDLGQGSRTPDPNMALNSDELLKAVMDKVGPRKPR